MVSVIFDPGDAKFRADPYPTYKTMLEHAPVYYFEGWRRWHFFTFEDCLNLLRDNRLGHMSCESTREFMGLPPLPERFRSVVDNNDLMMLVRNEPDHARLRPLMQKAFAPRSIAKMNAEIERITHRLLNTAESHGRFDLIGDFASPLSVLVIGSMLGIPEYRGDDLTDWSGKLASIFNATANEAEWDAAQVAFEQYCRYLTALTDERRRNLKEDLLSELVRVEEKGDRLTTDELLSNVLLLLIGGYETTVGLIGSGMLSLFQHPEQKDSLKRKPDLIAGTVEEMVRYCSPISGVLRVVLEPFEYKGIGFEPMQSVALVLAAANRDPRWFSNPNTFDINRPARRNLGFGVGIHNCLGAPLARIEASIAINTLLQRFPNLGLLEKAPTYRPSYVIRRLESLYVKL